MQIPNVKYLQTETGQYACFYQENRTIFYRTSTETGWSTPISAATHVLPMFSLCQYDRHTYLLYTTEAGELVLSASADLSHWTPRTLYHNAGTSPVKYFMIPQKDAFHVIYHTPAEQNGVQNLMYSVFRQGQWQTPYCIDCFLPLQQEIFRARRLGNDHIILYYRSGRNTICAREMLLSPFTIGSAAPLIQTGLPCVDFSILHDAEKMHILYVVRNMFRTQVLYRFKQSTAISNPRLLWEGSNCNSCLLHADAKRLTLFWTASGQTFRCVSENNGYLFGPIEQCTMPLPPYSIKGELISAGNFFGNAAELFGDRERGFLPATLPVVPDTSGQSATPPVQTPQTPPIGKDAFSSASAPSGETKNFSSFSPSANQTNQSADIQELTTLLAQRSEEISELNGKWQQRAQSLEDTVAHLQEENKILQNRLAAISARETEELSTSLEPTNSTESTESTESTLSE